MDDTLYLMVLYHDVLYIFNDNILLHLIIVLLYILYLLKIMVLFLIIYLNLMAYIQELQMRIHYVHLYYDLIIYYYFI